MLVKEAAEHGLVMISATYLHSTLSYFTQSSAAYNKNTWVIFPTDKIVLSVGQNYQNGLQKYATGGSKIKKENLISGSSRGYFWQSLISPEARKERSCQSFSASHIGPRADYLFHRPAFSRPGSKYHRALYGVFKTPQSALWLIQNATERFVTFIWDLTLKTGWLIDYFLD